MSDVDNGDATALVAANGGRDLIPAPEPKLPHHVGGDVRVPGLREVAGRSTTYETAVASDVEPSRRFPVGDDGDWRARVGLVVLMCRVRLVVAVRAAAAPMAATVATVAMLAPAVVVATLLGVATRIG